MNRSIALFVALAALLAHTLALHSDGSGNLAFSYDQSYAAYRLAHNLVVDGQLQWNPGTTAYESYASPVWVAVCAIAERLSATRISSHYGLFSINLICQTLGVLAMLACVVLTAQFRPERVASLIAPLILVASGCIAAAAANGLETALFTLIVVGLFLAFERGRAGWSFVCASLAVLTRPEGVFFVVALLVAQPFASRATTGESTRTRRAWPLVCGLLVFAGVCALRLASTGFVLPPSFAALVAPRPGQHADGLAYLRDFTCTFPAAFLALQPLVLALLGRLSGTGSRALALALVWLGYVALQGRAPLPFCELCVPAIPFLGIAIQEGLIVALDSPALARRRVAITAFVVALLVGVLPSNAPTDIGPIPLERWQRAWLAPTGSARFGYEQALGRAGLDEEIAHAHALRGIGLYLRDHLDPSASVLTPWPGAVGYLSRMPVYDLLGRANPIADLERPQAWSARGRVDLVAALRNDPPFDFVLADVKPFKSLPTPAELAQRWVEGLDDRAQEPGRVALVAAEFERYELVTVPIASNTRASDPMPDIHVPLLRRRALGLATKLELTRDDAGFAVRARHGTHRQIADLRVVARDEHGGEFWMRPAGEWTRTGPVAARVELLLYDTGTRAFDLVHAPLPATLDGLRVVSIEARLVNPEATVDQPYAWVSELARIEL